MYQLVIATKVEVLIKTSQAGGYLCEVLLKWSKKIGYIFKAKTLK
jgi:hypothetical protein